MDVDVYYVGLLSDILKAGTDARAMAQQFARDTHHGRSRNGTSYLATIVIDDNVFLMADSDKEHLIRIIDNLNVDCGEVLELTNLQ